MAAKVRSKTDRKRLDALLGVKEGRVRVGILGSKASAGKRVRDGEPPPLTVGEVAAIHEFGFGVPRRSWLRDPVEAMTPAIRNRLKIEAQRVIAGKQDSAQALERVGQFLQGELQQNLADGIGPPLKPATIARRREGDGGGVHKPLIDTGQLRSAISYQVVK